MEEEQIIVFTARELAVTKKKHPREQSPQEQAEARLIKALKAMKGLPFRDTEESVAKSMANLPGFIHLNPELIGAAVYFRDLTGNKRLKTIVVSKRDKTMKKVLYHGFPVVIRNEEKYAKLKADLLRYLLLMETQ